jgi:NifB/MoaA-like Fe-S oxidoreductase
LTKVWKGIKLREIRGAKMKGDEFKIILEDIDEKFDLLIEGHKLLGEKLDRHIEENRKEHGEIRQCLLGVKSDVSIVKTDVAEIKKDLNDHRNNTELHAIRKKKKAS